MEFIKDNAKDPCRPIYYPYDEKYAEDIRLFQGCPTIALTPKGRVYVAWYAGGVCEPHIENFSDLRYSDDGGKTWTPLFVLPSSEERWVHAWIRSFGRHRMAACTTIGCRTTPAPRGLVIRATPHMAGYLMILAIPSGA